MRHKLHGTELVQELDELGVQLNYRVSRGKVEEIRSCYIKGKHIDTTRLDDEWVEVCIKYAEAWLAKNWQIKPSSIERLRQSFKQALDVDVDVVGR